MKLNVQKWKTNLGDSACPIVADVISLDPKGLALGLEEERLHPANVFPRQKPRMTEDAEPGTNLHRGDAQAWRG